MIDYAKRLWENLELLGFSAEHTVDTFMNKSDAKLVDKMIHFLYTKMSPKESTTRFKGCWPVLEYIGNKDFRLAAFKWTIDLKEAGLLPPDLPLRRSFLDDGHGDKFVMIMMWISVWALRKQASLENYAQVKYPSSIYEPYACSKPEFRDELHEKYIPTQKEVFGKVIRIFQGKRVKIEAIISAFERPDECTELHGVEDDSIENAALIMLQSYKEKAKVLEEFDRRDEMYGKLSEAEEALQAAKSENERLRAELQERSLEVFGPGMHIGQKKETICHPALYSAKKEQLITALLSADILKSDKCSQESSHNPSILGSDLDADFLVR